MSNSTVNDCARTTRASDGAVADTKAIMASEASFSEKVKENMRNGLSKESAIQSVDQKMIPEEVAKNGASDKGRKKQVGEMIQCVGKEAFGQGPTDDLDLMYKNAVAYQGVTDAINGKTSVTEGLGHAANWFLDR